MVHVGVLLEPLESFNSIGLAGGERCESNDVMDYVGVLLEPLESFTSICLAGGSGATATLGWNMLVYCSSCLNHITKFVWLVQTMRTQQCCDWLCRCIAGAIKTFESFAWPADAMRTQPCDGRNWRSARAPSIL